MKIAKISTLSKAMAMEQFNNHAVFSNPEADEKIFYSEEVPVVKVDIGSIPQDQLAKLPDRSRYTYLHLEPGSQYGAVVADGKLVAGIEHLTVLKAMGATETQALDLTGLIDTRLAGWQADVKIKPLEASKELSNNKTINL